MNLRTTALATALVAASVPSLPVSANAHGWGWGWGWGWGGLGLGLLAGAAITKALAAPYYGGYYGYPGYYAYGIPTTATAIPRTGMPQFLLNKARQASL